MVIDYEKYPTLKILKENKINSLDVLDVDELFFNSDNGATWKDKMLQNRNIFLKEISFISETFIKAATSNFSKLYALKSGFFLKEDSEYLYEGTFIFKYLKRNEVIHFSIKKNIGQVKPEISLFQITEGYPYLSINDGNCWVTDAIDQKQFSVEWTFTLICIILLFKEFAKLEVKTVFPKQKISDRDGKHLNNTDLPIVKLDCNWFTDLIKSEGFKVRGHFRLQPCINDGKWTKSLIWINDFEKNGYTRKAKTPNRNENLL